MPNLNRRTGEKEMIAERRVKALELRKTGGSYRQIGRALGVSQETAHKDVMHGLAELATQAHGHAEEYRALEVERLDVAILAVATLVRAGDLAAIDRWIRLSESRRKLLGLDLPVKVAPTTPDGEESYAGTGVADVAGWLARLAAGIGATGISEEPDA